MPNEFLLPYRLTGNDDSVDSLTYSLTINSKTRVSFGTRPHMKMSVGQEYHIDCLASGGIPTPELVASVGPTRDASEEDMLLEPVHESSDGILGGDVHKLFKYNPNSDFR